MSGSEARRPPPPFDLTIVTGFLGAGKTTFLNRLLRDPDLADTLVLINEFGSVGLDHLLMERVDGDMILMTSGCICCSIRGDLVATLEDVLRKRDNGRMRAFERIIIETTGLADPAPILQTIMTHPYLRLRFRLRTVVTLVDALLGLVTLERHKEAVRQVAVADSLMLSKTDLVLDKGPIEHALRTLNPAAAILDPRSGASAKVLFSGPAYATTSRDVVAWLAVDAYPAAGSHNHHHHDVNRHDASIQAFCLRETRAVPAAALSLFMELLRSAHGPRLLRFKGLVALSDDPTRPVVAHGVQHVMHPLERLAGWPDADHETRLVFILDGLDPAFVEAMWRAATGGPSIDEPDLQLDNPLAPTASGLLAKI